VRKEGETMGVNAIVIVENSDDLHPDWRDIAGLDVDDLSLVF